MFSTVVVTMAVLSPGHAQYTRNARKPHSYPMKSRTNTTEIISSTLRRCAILSLFNPYEHYRRGLIDPKLFIKLWRLKLMLQKCANKLPSHLQFYSRTPLHTLVRLQTSPACLSILLSLPRNQHKQGHLHPPAGPFTSFIQGSLVFRPLTFRI